MKRPMLKAIIQNNAIDRMVFQHPSTQGNSISTHRNNCIRTPLCDKERLIPRFRWAGQESRSVGHEKMRSRAHPFIPSAQDRHALSFGHQTLRKENDDRSFPRSPDGKISHTHDPTGQASD